VAKMMFYKETNFKETPIGKIPKDWEVVRSADVFDVDWGNTSLTKAVYKASGYPVFSATGQDGLTDFYEHEGEAIILSAIGAQAGKCFYASGKWTAIKNTIIIKPKTENVYVLFAFYYMNKENYWKRLGTGQPFIALKNARSQLIPLPTFQEQKRIAEVLGVVDSVIAKTDEAIAKTERLKKSLIQELLIKGLILGFMFDTNIFDEILDEKIELPKNLRYYVTHIQYDEILNIPMNKKERREKLLKIFNKVPKEVIATEGAVLGVSRLELSKLMSKEDAELYDKMLKKLKELDEKSGKKKTPENQARDILIALTCMKNCLTLVTNDNNLKKVAQEFQCSAITFEQLLKGEYREFKDTEIGRIPKEWEIAKITNLFDLYKGTTPSTKVKEYWNGSIPFVTPTDITKVSDLNEIYLKTTENYITEEGLKSKGLKLVPENSLLFTSRATIGYLAINKIKVAINQGIISLIPKDANVDITFFYYLLQKLRFLFENLAGGSTYKEISMSTFSNISVPLPSLLEQQKITEILLTIDKKLEIKRNEKAKLEKIKQGLMDLLLTGKIRVKVD
jgi:restriction endonuclease S subunit